MGTWQITLLDTNTNTNTNTRNASDLSVTRSFVIREISRFHGNWADYPALYCMEIQTQIQTQMKTRQIHETNRIRLISCPVICHSGSKPCLWEPGGLFCSKLCTNTNTCTNTNSNTNANIYIVYKHKYWKLISSD